MIISVPGTVSEIDEIDLQFYTYLSNRSVVLLAVRLLFYACLIKSASLWELIASRSRLNDVNDYSL